MDEFASQPLASDLAMALETGFRLWKEGALSAARTTLEQTLEEATNRGSLSGRLSALQLLGNLAFDRGDLAAARALHELLLAECRAQRLGVGIASSLHNLGLLAVYEDDGVTARNCIAEAINLYEQIGLTMAAERARASLRWIATTGEGV